MLNTDPTDSAAGGPSMSDLDLPAVIAVLVVDDAADALPLAECLLDNGIRAMELTLRTPAALEALAAVRSGLPEMLAGVGTVLTPDQVRQVRAAGAAFGVAPGLNRAVLEAARDAGLPFAPGVATPSDVEAGLEYGCRVLKFFPAEPSGGLGYLKSMAAPYAHLGLTFVPLGGLNADNLGEWLASPLVSSVGGSWLAPRDLIRARKWAEIGARAADATRIVEQTRQGEAK